MSVHHIVADGWSVELINRELLSLYDDYVNGRPVSLRKLQIQYKDFAQWQNRLIESGVFDEDVEYWKAQLGQSLKPLSIEYDFDRDASSPSGRCKSVRAIFFDRELSGLRSLSHLYAASNFIVVLGAVKGLLRLLADQDDISLVIPVSGRDRPELEGQCGLYLNLLILKDRIAKEMALGEIVLEVRETVLNAFKHQNVPFDLVYDAAGIQKMAGGRSVLDVEMDYHTFESMDERELAKTGLRVRQLDSRNLGRSNFDLCFIFSEKDDSLGLELVYNPKLFSEARIGKYIKMLGWVLEYLRRQPRITIETLRDLLEVKILSEWREHRRHDFGKLLSSQKSLQ